MAEKDAVIEIEDEGTVTVDVTDHPDLAVDPVEPEPKPVVTAPKPKTPAVDEAAAALTAATKTAETERAARLAAEQTANSERQARLAAEEARRVHEEENESLRERAGNSELTAVTSGIEAAKQAQEAAQREFERAMEAGEFPKASAAQVALSRAAAQIDRLEADKIRLESAPKRPVTEGRVEAPAGSPVEKYLAGFSPKSQSWLRSHMDCLPPALGGNRVKHAAMMLGHETAGDSGIPLESDDYFRTIEEKVGLREPVSAAAVVTPAEEATPKSKAAKVQPSAPVNRDVPAASGARTTRSVTLNKDQREAAKLSFPHLPEKEAFGIYARNLLDLESEGKIGRVTH
jgi:hypothetical protein